VGLLRHRVSELVTNPWVKYLKQLDGTGRWKVEMGQRKSDGWDRLCSGCSLIYVSMVDTV
jgi:hypothetical protein